MKPVSPHELPPDREPAMRRARLLAWITIAWLASVVVLVYLVMGNSQAMKAAWAEDMLGLVPATAFLIAARVRRRRPNQEYPYGFHRAVSVAYLCGALALLAMGLYLVYDSGIKLIRTEHPTIGTMVVLGEQVWQGWLMLAVLVYSAVPPVILGLLKLPLSERLHDKVLHTDAMMNKADWLTAMAAMVGVVGIGYGLWWVDAVAALFISVDVLRDGVRNMRRAVGDLMDRAPRKVSGKEPDPLPEQIRRTVLEVPWVREADVRVREEGHVMFVDLTFVPESDQDLTRRCEDLREIARGVDWRVHEVAVQPVRPEPRSEAPKSARAEAAT